LRQTCLGQRCPILQVHVQHCEVLVTRTVTDHVVGSGIVFEDRGERELKGVPGKWRLFGVMSVGRRSIAAS
jgi:hypothetical protein